MLILKTEGVVGNLYVDDLAMCGRDKIYRHCLRSGVMFNGIDPISFRSVFWR